MIFVVFLKLCINVSKSNCSDIFSYHVVLYTSNRISCFIYIYYFLTSCTGYLKTAIIVTDGESILDDVTLPAQRLRDSGVEVFSIGVKNALR